MNIDVELFERHVSIDSGFVDGTFWKYLRRHANGRGYAAMAGTANVAWKSAEDRLACIADHDTDDKRKQRWQDIQESMKRMANGEFPPYGHLYLHPSLHGFDGLMVLDGTRRTVAYLESGYIEIPVVVIVPS